MTPENIGAFIAIIASIVITIGGGATVIITTGMRIREMRAHSDNDGIKRDIETENMLRAELKAAAAKSDAAAKEMRDNHAKTLDLVRDQGNTITELRINLVKAEQKIEGYTGIATAREAVIVGLQEKVVSLEGVIAGLKDVIKGLQDRIDVLEAREKAAA